MPVKSISPSAPLMLPDGPFGVFLDIGIRVTDRDDLGSLDRLPLPEVHPPHESETGNPYSQHSGTSLPRIARLQNPAPDDP